MKIYVGSAYYRAIETEHMKCILQMLTRPNITFAPTYNDALICRARSKTATAFLGSDCDVHVSVDGDIIFDPRALEMIAEQAVDYDIVCGQYVTRSRQKCQPTSMQEQGVEVEYGLDPTPIPILWGATGFMAIHRRVFEKLSQREDMPLCHEGEPNEFRPFYMPMPYRRENGKYIYLSEDYALCERARQEGFTVHVNPAVRILHLGQYPFRLEDLVNPEPGRAIVKTTRVEGGNWKTEAGFFE